MMSAEAIEAAAREIEDVEYYATDYRERVVAILTRHFPPVAAGERERLARYLDVMIASREGSHFLSAVGACEGCDGWTSHIGAVFCPACGTKALRTIASILRGEREAIKAAFVEGESVARLMDALEMAWGLIANAGEGNWGRERPEWKEAAERWRDEYWHPALGRNRPAAPTVEAPEGGK